MDILPITSLVEEDAQLAGSGLVNLAKLHQSKIPIAQGIVVFPPEFKLQSILEYYQINDREVFEQRMEFVKKDVLKIPLSDNLKKVLNQKKIDSQKLWLYLLEIW